MDAAGRDGSDVVYASMLREMITQGREFSGRYVAESAETIVWVVGLASALLAASFAEPEEVRRVLGTNHAWTAAALWLAIVGGASYRVLTLWLSGRINLHLFDLEGRLTGYVGGSRMTLPALLSSSWGQAQIVAHIKSEFGQDYQFLLLYDTPLDQCQQIYHDMYDDWFEHDKKSRESIDEMVRAYFDLKPATTFDLSVVRRRMRFYKRAGKCGTVLFALAVAAFVLAMFLIVRGLWIS